MRHSLKLALVFALIAAAHAGADDRVGWREDFSSAEGWEQGTWPGITAMASITSDGQQTTFTTLNGTFMTGASAAWAPDWPDWDKNAAAGLAMMAKRYPTPVDLDRYHYLVVHMPLTGTFMAFAVNGWDTKVCYTAGLHAVDLHDLGQPSLHGQQPIEIRLTFLNTEGKVTLDEARLVDQLTPDEQAGFIGKGLDLRPEQLEPKPYHGLEALNARAGAPIRFDMPNEGAVFHDTSTGATIRRLTSSTRLEMANIFSPDGALLPILNRSFRGMVFYDLGQGEMEEFADLRGPSVFSRERPGVIYMLQPVEDRPQITYAVRAMNLRTREIETVAEVPTGDAGFDLGISSWSDLLIVAATGPRVLFLVDPRIPDPAKRVRRIDLPMRMKGALLSHHDQRINWQRCFYFQSWQMDLATGQVQLGGNPAYGAHDLMGRDIIVGRYSTMLIARRFGVLPTDEAHADEIKIWSNWATPVPSDYGYVADDDRWAVTNCSEGPLAGKRILIDGDETGTVLQIVHDFTSRNSWDSNTYTRISPDTTKIAYMCDMLGDTDVYMAITRRPQAPRNVTLAREGGKVRLKWEAPAEAREIAGYNVYRSGTSGRGYRRLNRERIAGLEFVDEAAPAAACYAVAAEEHSGLEGLYSPEVQFRNVGPTRIYADVEEGALTPPLRQSFDGDCANFRCARIWKEAPEEKTGQARLGIDVPKAGGYTVWLRCKGEGTVQCGPAQCVVKSGEWAWVRAEGTLALKAGRQELTLASESDGLCVDLAMLTSEASDRPVALDDRDVAPAPVEGLHVTEATAAQVRLAWTPVDDPTLDDYSVYVGDRADFTPGNATVLCSGRKPEALDWGFKPGSTLYYKVVATNQRGLSSPPATVRVPTPAMQTATVELKIEDATLSGGLERAESRGVVGAYLPAPLAKEAPRPTATWQYNAPVDGTYYLWAKYTTYDAKNVSVFWIENDGRPHRDGVNWRLRFPQTLTRHQGGTKPGEETWFSDKVMSAWWAGPADSVDLKAGAHTLAVAFEPTHAPNGPRLAAVYLSNDPSYRPPGFDPRIDFTK